MKINIAKVIGRGYKEFWNTKKRYVVVKGGRGSKKSKTAALWIIYNMMKYPLANTLVIREIYKDNRDSTIKDLEWATYKLGVRHLWKFNTSPLEATYLPTGQKIYFRGLNDPMSITSITVSKGFLCWAWFEEAYQITSEDAFNKVDMSIRGELPDGYFKRIMFTLNPWNEGHWIKKRFFDDTDENTLAITTTYKCNEWLGDDDLEIFNNMRVKYPRRYSIEGEGNWGIAEGLIFDNWRIEDFDYQKLTGKLCVGIDFGYIDPTTIIQAIVDESNKKIYVFSEWYKNNVITQDIYNALLKLNLSKSQIFADSARPEQIEELRRKGIARIQACSKGKDSIINGINQLLEYEIIVHKSCQHIVIELQNYCWDTDRNTGKKLEKPIDDFCHCIDALRYAMQCLNKNMKLQTMNKSILGL